MFANFCQRKDIFGSFIGNLKLVRYIVSTSVFLTAALRPLGTVPLPMKIILSMMAD